MVDISSMITGGPQGARDYTAKTVNRKFETNIPRNENYASSVPIPTHSCYCERFICSHDRSAYSATRKEVDTSWEYINRSQIHDIGN
jgi:hypothetical protein